MVEGPPTWGSDPGRQQPGTPSAGAVQPGPRTSALPFILGSGDLLGGRVTVPPAAHFADLRDGSAAAPVTIGVTASWSRVDATSRAEVNAMGPVGTDGPDGATVGRFAIKGTAASQVQVVAGFFSAWQTGEANGGEASPDAAALYGLARVTNNGIGRAIPLYLESRRETATSAGQQAVELRVVNLSGETDVYSVGGPSKSMGEWINAQSGQVGAAYQVGHGFGAVFDAAFVINEGAVKSVGYRDASNAANSILITGEHTAGAIKVEMTAGTYDPAVLFKVLGNASSHSLQLANGNAGQKVFVSGGAGTFLSDTAAGDVGVQITTAGRAWRVGTAAAGSMLVVNNTGVGFNGKAPVAAPARPATLEGVINLLAANGLSQ